MLDGEVHAGHTTTELFASGGVHALVRLLDNVLEYAREPQRSVWVREVLALLYPLVRRSRMVARLLVSLSTPPIGALWMSLCCAVKLRLRSLQSGTHVNKQQPQRTQK